MFTKNQRLQLAYSSVLVHRFFKLASQSVLICGMNTRSASVRVPAISSTIASLTTLELKTSSSEQKPYRVLEVGTEHDPLLHCLRSAFGMFVSPTHSESYLHERSPQRPGLGMSMATEPLDLHARHTHDWPEGSQPVSRAVGAAELHERVADAPYRHVGPVAKAWLRTKVHFLGSCAVACDLSLRRATFGEDRQLRHFVLC